MVSPFMGEVFGPQKVKSDAYISYLMTPTMDFDKINNLALKITGVIIAAFLFIGGLGGCVNHLYLKGAVGILVAPIIAYLGFRPASFKSWGLLIVTFFITMYIVGTIGNK
jgi:hypothetical protein